MTEVSPVPGERLPQVRLEAVGLPHHPEVARRRAIGRGLGIVAEQVIAGEVVETGDAVFRERGRARPSRGVIVGVERGERWPYQALVCRRSSTSMIGAVGRAARICLTNGTHLSVTIAASMFGRQSIT